MQPIDFSDFHDACLHRWQVLPWRFEAEGFLAIVESNHALNYQLWQAEDRARREDKGPEFVYLAKREIDRCNQARNDRMEAMDSFLYGALAPADASTCPVHSETPGMMIDRLSILTLKIFHMALQVQRTDVDAAHQQTCQKKLDLLFLQRQRLQQCLRDLLSDVEAKRRTFYIYHQFKMYNDPALNPQLYETTSG